MIPSKQRYSGPVLITGLGVISAAGLNIGQTLETFESGQRHGGPITVFQTDLPYPVFEVSKMPADYDLPGNRTLGLTLYAAKQAMDAACLPENLSGRRVGVCLGTTVACQLNDIDYYTAYRQNNAAPMDAIDRFLTSNIADATAARFGCNGPAATIVNACSSGTDAIGMGLSWLRSGLCDIVLAGGADEMNRIPVTGFGSLGIFSPELCRPFDRDRAGLNLGEGAGIIVMETAASAANRGVSSRLQVAGFGSHADAHHLTAPHPEGVGLRAAINKALSDAEFETGDIAFVNAHGTATRNNDAVEGLVLADMFGADIPVYSTKGHTGHTLGAAGGLEAAFTAAALEQGWIPASAGFENQDEEIPLAPVSQKTEIRQTAALSTSLAFGGNNSAVIIQVKS